MVGVEEELLKPANDNHNGFEDYAQWVLKQTGHTLLSCHKKTIMIENDLEKAELPDFEDPNPVELTQTVHFSEPKITYIKNGESVSQIEIRCKCGEIIEIDLDYQQK